MAPFRRWLPTLGAVALYAVLTVALTWPFAARLRIIDAGDSAYFAWVMAWELHALFTDPLSLPHTNMLYPHRFTLGMDEPVLGTAILLLPLRLFTADAVFLFNVARLLTYLLSALTAYLLARELGTGEGPAFFAGATFAFSPIRTDQIAHLSTLGTQWLPLVLLFLVRFVRRAGVNPARPLELGGHASTRHEVAQSSRGRAERGQHRPPRPPRGGRWRHALLAALFFVLAALACGYHGMLGLVVLPFPAVVLLWGRWRLWPKAVAAAALTALGLLPLLLLHRAALGPFGFVRGVEETRFYSAALETFLATSSWNRLWGPLTAPFRTTYANNLFPGLTLTLLVLSGALMLSRRRRRPSREAIALAVMAIAAALVCLGPEVRLFGQVLYPGPFGFLRETVPLFRNLRVTARAGIFVALALSMLSAKALALWQPRRWVLAALTALALAETLIVPIPTPSWMDVVDTRKPQPPVYEWLAAQPGAPVVAELPMLDIEGVINEPAFHESIYLVHSTRHWKPLVNGTGGVEPPDYLNLRERLRRFPSEEAIAALWAQGVRYVILHRWGYGPNKWARIERDLPRFVGGPLHEVARFEGDTVYELRPLAP